MTYKICHRCHADLPPHDDGSLIFCAQCGAPQVLLSEELQLQVEMQAAAADNAQTATPPARSLVWAEAIRCAGLAGLVAAVLACLSAVLPALILVTLLWAVISPIVALGFFQNRFPLRPVNTGFGARLGLLTGLSETVALGVISTVSLLISRFKLNNMADFDAQWTMQLDQLRARSAADVLPLIKMYSLPEFRAGMMLAGMGFGILLLLTVTTAGGAFAGFVRSRPRT